MVVAQFSKISEKKKQVTVQANLKRSYRWNIQEVNHLMSLMKGDQGKGHRKGGSQDNLKKSQGYRRLNPAIREEVKILGHRKALPLNQRREAAPL